MKLPYNFAKNGLAGDKIMHLALKRLSVAAEDGCSRIRGWLSALS